VDLAGFTCSEYNQALCQPALFAKMSQPREGFVMWLIAHWKGPMANGNEQLGAKVTKGLQGIEGRHVLGSSARRVVAGHGKKCHIGVQAASDLLEARKICCVACVVYGRIPRTSNVATGTSPSWVPNSPSTVVTGRDGGYLHITLFDRLTRGKFQHTGKTKMTHERSTARRNDDHSLSR
jgi:hypothetical protein